MQTQGAYRLPVQARWLGGSGVGAATRQTGRACAHSTGHRTPSQHTPFQEGCAFTAVGSVANTRLRLRLQQHVVEHGVVGQRTLCAADRVQRVPETSISTRRSGCRQATSLAFRWSPRQSCALVTG